MPGFQPTIRVLLAAAMVVAIAMPADARPSPLRETGLQTTKTAPPRREPPARLQPRESTEAPVDGSVRLVVKATARAGVGGLKNAGRAMGFKVRKTIPRINWTTIDVPAQQAKAIAARLKAEGVASSVERDLRTTLADIPDDPMFGALWGLENTGQAGGVPDADIDASAAWDRTIGSSSVVVAVCDTGIDRGHPDLASNIWQNPGEVPDNGVDDDANGWVDDVNGWDWVHGDKTVYDMSDGELHGTHVAGTIGAVGDNGVGVTGVNQDVSIMALKTIGAGGSGSLADAAEAIVYAVDNGATVINHSWISPGTIKALDDAILYAEQHGVLNVAAAGNEGTDNEEIPYYPAALPNSNVIAVAATNATDTLPVDKWDWSWSNRGEAVDLAAPGSGILSTVPFSSYTTYNGTSMAAPHVTGAAALIKAAFPAATMAEIRARIEETVDRPSVAFGPYGDVRTDGRLNAARALAPEIAAAPVITVPAPGATVRPGEAQASWTPSPFTSASATYEVQAGVEAQLYEEGFEGELSGWFTDGDEYWQVSSDHALVHSGTYAVRSGDKTPDNGYSALGRTITVPPGGGVLEFWYMLDSEDRTDSNGGGDFAYLLLGDDAHEVWEMNQDRGWTKARVPVPEGTHDVWWVYQKNGSVVQGLDALAVDDVRVTARQWGEVVQAPPGATSGLYEAPLGDGPAVVRVRAVLGGQESNWTEVTGLTIADVPPLPAADGLAAEALDRSSRLTWSASVGPGFHHWNVRRASGAGPFEVVGTTSSAAFIDPGLTNGVLYRYRLEAVDGAGNIGLPSGTVDVMPVDVWPPSSPTGLTAVADHEQIRLDWDDATEPDVTGWEVWRSSDGSEHVKIADVVSPTYADVDLVPGVAYTYEVVAVDDDGNRSAPAAVTEVPLDLEPPAAPSGLSAVSRDRAALLTWEVAPEEDFAFWQVWRASGSGEFELLDTTTEPDYFDAALTNGAEYRYRIVAVDRVGNGGGPSDTVSVVPQDEGPPSAPAGLKPMKGYGEIWLEWSDAPEPDVVGWEVWRAAGSSEASMVAEVTSPTFHDTDLSSAIEYHYSVRATDDDGFVGPFSGVSVRALDHSAPGTVTGVRAVPGPGRVMVEWTRGPEPDLAEWDVYRSVDAGMFTKIATVGVPTFVDLDVKNMLSHTYQVRPRDYSGNVGPVSNPVTAIPRATERRLQGANRYATAIAVSASTFAAGSAETVVLATGEAFPDALSASALAGCYRGPLLLTPSAKLAAGLTAELARLGAKKVVIVGGTSAVSSAVERALASAGYSASRIQGRDRYETAARVATKVKSLAPTLPGGAGQRVFVARGDTFPDALSASPAAYAKRYPVLLVQSGSIPAVTRNAIASLRPTDAVVLGSSGAVSESVKRSLGVPSTRWGGTTRYETSAIIARKSTEAGWTSFGAVGIVTGASFPDALGGGAAIGARSGVLLLTPGITLSTSARNEIAARVHDIDNAFVIGGTAAVSGGVEASVKALLGL